MIKRTIYALIMVAVVAMPTASTALAAGGQDRAAQRAATRIDRTLDSIDAGIVHLDTKIERVEDRLDGDLRDRQRQRLELEQQRLEQKQQHLELLRDSILGIVCGIPALQLIVPQCGWSD